MTNERWDLVIAFPRLRWQRRSAERMVLDAELVVAAHDLAPVQFYDLTAHV